MGYYESLSNIIKESGKTLKELSEECRKEGVKIDPSYISKLQTRKLPPASEEINTAIAKACNADVDLLLYEAYMEEAPLLIKSYITKSLASFKQVSKAILSTQLPENMLSLIDEQLNKLPDVFFIKQFLEQEVPQVGHNDFFIAKDQNNTDVKYLLSHLLDTKMLDNSMEPRIPMGSKIHLDNPDKVKSGDFVAVKLDDDIHVVRRLVIVDDQILLLSENLEYPPIIISNKDSLQIVGKVKAVTIDV
ncbi:S24 family peptidase [Brevibacillus parabrevis]|uniref:Peptidase S24/S26A/S26B/S26C domain-containing protein n=1 Tax=Brevibacillus parabrevis TaxID=54914 RepID=A0A4Y3PFR2_BREPA|nr:S24 family peptidase [Brevibacillus parabrevis]RNB92943.1 hypothetical protein EDM60_23925 [Brevibacillus parabrevis]GEB32187.1 hypothetical protein BPA01_17670 [Brevibacillus parabrevis]